MTSDHETTCTFFCKVIHETEFLVPSFVFGVSILAGFVSLPLLLLSGVFIVDGFGFPALYTDNTNSVAIETSILRYYILTGETKNCYHVLIRFTSTLFSN